LPAKKKQAERLSSSQENAMFVMGRKKSAERAMAFLPGLEKVPAFGIPLVGKR